MVATRARASPLVVVAASAALVVEAVHHLEVAVAPAFLLAALPTRQAPASPLAEVAAVRTYFCFIKLTLPRQHWIQLWQVISRV